MGYFFALILFLGSRSSAELLKKTQGSASIEKVLLSREASFLNKGKTVTLKKVGAGLRRKKILFVNVDVYVAEFFVPEKVTIDRSPETIMGTISQLDSLAIQLTFLMDVDGEKVKNSFKEALTANKIDEKEPGIDTLLSKVVQGGKIKKGKTLTFVGVKESPSEDIIYFESNSDDVSSIKAPGLIKSVFSMWFGEGADSGLKTLKSSLLSVDSP